MLWAVRRIDPFVRLNFFVQKENKRTVSAMHINKTVLFAEVVFNVNIMC